MSKKTDKKTDKRSHHSGAERPAPKGKGKLPCMTITLPFEPDLLPVESPKPCPEAVEAQMDVVVAVAVDVPPIPSRVEVDALLTGYETYWLGKKYTTIVAVLPDENPVLKVGEVRRCKLILEPPAPLQSTPEGFNGNKPE